MAKKRLAVLLEMLICLNQKLSLLCATLKQSAPLPPLDPTFGYKQELLRNFFCLQSWYRGIYITGEWVKRSILLDIQVMLLELFRKIDGMLIISSLAANADRGLEVKVEFRISLIPIVSEHVVEVCDSYLPWWTGPDVKRLSILCSNWAEESYGRRWLAPWNGALVGSLLNYKFSVHRGTRAKFNPSIFTGTRSIPSE